MNPPLLQVQNLTKQFTIKGSASVVSAVGDVTFEINRAETLGLVGESGSGKTTVGRCLLRLVEPSTGKVFYDGADVTHISKKQFLRYRRAMQMVFQEPHFSLNPRYTAYDTVVEPLALHGEAGRPQLRERVFELLRLVRLDRAKYQAFPHQMSSGEQQRLSIARAIATNPKLVVLDEPTSMLDLSVRAEIIDLLIEIQEKTGMAYLFISHDLTTVEYLCHRVAVMYLGQIVEMGTVSQIFNAPRHPYSCALLSAALPADPTVRRPAYVLKGEIPSPVNLPSGCYLASRCPAVDQRCRAMPQSLQSLSDGRLVRCWRVAEEGLLLMANQQDASEQTTQSSP